MVIAGNDAQQVSLSRLTSRAELIVISNDMHEDGLYQESSWYMARASEAARNGGSTWIYEGDVYLFDLSVQARRIYDDAQKSGGKFPKTVEFDKADEDDATQSDNLDAPRLD